MIFFCGLSTYFLMSQEAARIFFPLIFACRNFFLLWAHPSHHFSSGPSLTQCRLNLPKHSMRVLEVHTSNISKNVLRTTIVYMMAA